MTLAEFNAAIECDYDREFDAVITAEYPEQEQRGTAGHPAWEDDVELLAELRECEECPWLFDGDAYDGPIDLWPVGEP